MKQTSRVADYIHPDSDIALIELYYVLADSNTEPIDDDENEISW